LEFFFKNVFQSIGLVIFGDISMRVVKRLDFLVVDRDDSGQDVISTVVGLDKE
jgi:hypothetical protein